MNKENKIENLTNAIREYSEYDLTDSDIKEIIKFISHFDVYKKLRGRLTNNTIPIRIFNEGNKNE